jgi:hypothetical protein
LCAKIFWVSEKKLQNYHVENLSQAKFESRKIKINCQSAVLSAENWAFEKLKNSAISACRPSLWAKSCKSIQFHTK